MAAGDNLRFDYTNLNDGKVAERFVRVEEVKISRENQEIITAWDYDAFGFRSFRTANMSNVVVV